MRLLSLLSTLFLFCIGVHAQIVTDLFAPRPQLSRDFHRVTDKYQALQLNTQQLGMIRNELPERLELQLPFENQTMQLNLTKTSITSDQFQVIEALPGGARRTVNYEGAVFYQGKIEGAEHSIATISIFNNQVMGVISDSKSNIVLGAIESNGIATNEYTMYRDRDLLIPDPFHCGTGESPVPAGNTNTTTANTTATSSQVSFVGEPVDIYFECDYKFYQDKGNSTNNVVNYVLGFFNNTAQLYSVENIKIQVSQILVWTTQDPEAAGGYNTTSTVLNSFSGRMATATYSGDYAHFLSTRSLGGGIAYLLGSPCAMPQQFKTGVSAIYTTYSDVPTYSWTVEVVTHELGHNLGSNHTQWCGWTGGALDNCYTTEGGCAAGPAPANGGTIMSYCHLTGYGINFSNGFGQQPGDKIRSVVSSSSCFGNCKMTLSMSKTDASCGLNNGSATVTAINGTGALSYLWSNGQTGATLTNVGPGTYNVKVTDAAGCQVLAYAILINNGSSLTATLTPSTPTSFCTGSPVLLTASFNASYTYQWYKDAVLIGGATSNTYTATSTGTYSVLVSAGACNVTPSVAITEVAVPTATIIAGGATTFCSGGSVTLNATTGAGYTYQWYNNAVAIGGATNSSYSATTSGSYTVRVSGGTCQSTSSATVVTVNTTPSATISAGGPTTLCTGGSVTLNANTGAGYTYQWYNNAIAIGGATNSSYVAIAAGNYTVKVISGSCETISSAAIVIVSLTPAAQITAGGATLICVGSTTALNANTGSGYTYIWYKDGVVIDNALNPSYNADVTGAYTVKVTSAGCSATSSPVAITVNPAPQAAIQVSGTASFCAGGSVNLQATAGSGYTYQWYNNGAVLNGANQQNYAATTSGDYTVIVTLGACSSLSGSTLVTVLASPVVIVNPATVTIQKFQTQTITASGGASYNWNIQPALVSQAASSAVFMPLTTTQYQIEGTDANGCKSSATSTITVVGCGDVTNITSSVQSPSRAVLSWTNPSGASSDTIQYRKSGSGIWNKLFITGGQYTLNGLDPGTLYEYNIIPVCNTTNVYFASTNRSLQTPSLPAGVFLKLYPNPVQAGSQVEVIVDKPFTLDIGIFNSLGQKMMTVAASENLSAGQFIRTIDPALLKPGVYHMAVTVNGKLYNLKMVVAP
ncbi:MAG TPA: M12 family metallo-peptidase [Chitinophagaceae bacterium]|nr:M12 family metallo-peptidase [Chitinophagaceae bacterium]